MREVTVCQSRAVTEEAEVIDPPLSLSALTLSDGMAAQPDPWPKGREPDEAQGHQSLSQGPGKKASFSQGQRTVKSMVPEKISLKEMKPPTRSHKRKREFEGSSKLCS